MNNQTDKIVLELDRERYTLVLRQYGLEGAKNAAINMALAQYSERPITAAHLYSCLSNLESDLAGSSGLGTLNFWTSTMGFTSVWNMSGVARGYPKLANVGGQ